MWVGESEKTNGISCLVEEYKAVDMITPERASLSETGTDSREETDDPAETKDLCLLKASMALSCEQQTLSYFILFITHILTHG